VTAGATLGNFADGPALRDTLAARGLDEFVAVRKSAALARCRDRMREADLPDRAPACAFLVPGRIEVLGKHTDYAGGRSLLACAEQGFALLAAPRQDNRVRLWPVEGNAPCEFAIGPGLSPAAGHWSNYPMTVARRLARNFPGPLRGADIAFVSDLPPAAGMSSSSAMVVATFLALSHANDLPSRQEYRRNLRTPEDLAGYLGCVENGSDFGDLAGGRGVGTFGGSEDHTAILCCRADALSLYSYCPVRHEATVPLPPDAVFAVAASGVVAEKTGQALARYNRVSARARAALEAWNRAAGRSDRRLAAAAVSDPGAPERIRKILLAATGGEFSGADLADRFEQFYAESFEIIPAAIEALRHGDLAGFGAQVERSQGLAERLLDNQIPETRFLARGAREQGAWAASAFGAGFGGAVWALVPRARGEAFLSAWSERYRRAFPSPAERAAFFLTRAAPAAFAIG